MTSFVSVEDYETRLDLTLDSSQIASVEAALDAACQDVRDSTHQDFDYVAADIWVTEGTGTRALILPQLPVLSVASVVVCDETVTDWWLDTPNAVLYRRSSTGWPCLWPLWAPIVVTYEHGFETDSDGFSTVPPNVRDAVIALAKLKIEQDARTSGIQSETIGPFTVSYASASATGDTEQLSILNTLAARILRQSPVT